MTDTDIPHPRFTYDFLGHARVESFFLDQLKSGKLGQAYLFHGLQGVGKATFAYRLAKALLSGRDFSQSQSLRVPIDAPSSALIEAQSHPDFFVLEAVEGETLKAEQARDVRKFVQSTAVMGGYRVVLVDGVEQFNTAAANALLKVLEEPTPRCVFLLVSHHLQRVLPTIRSRCQKIGFEGLEDEHLKKLLAHISIDVDFELLQVAQGSLRWCMRLQGGSFGAHLAPFFLGETLKSSMEKDALAIKLSNDKLFDFNLLKYFFDKKIEDNMARIYDPLARKNLAQRWSEHTQKIMQSEVYNLDKRALILQTLDILYPEI